MRQFQTRKVMEFLREKSKKNRSNNLRINEWIDSYLERCFLNGKEVNILTQWCISKDLEERFKKQGNRFMPTKKERKLFEKELPEILNVFLENGFQINWWITFNRSYLNSGRIDKGLEDEYKKMIEKLGEIDQLIFLDWEDDVLENRPYPNKEIMENVEQYIEKSAFKIEFERHSKWAKEKAGLKQEEEELKNDVKFQIACEIEEGKLLTSKKFPFQGEFILIPLESPERYDFFKVLSKDFKKRIISVLSYYPWRIK